MYLVRKRMKMIPYSIIIPVYNRPDEVDDLLDSLVKQTYRHFEVIVVEDGSAVPCRSVVDRYRETLDVHYFAIENRGPGGARNYGASQSRGEYLLILDSDCVLPPAYLEHVHESLERDPAEAFGGPDRAHESFTPIQKAISYSMTSFFTTGGIRGGKRKLDAFYPRSFNMGVRRDVYLALGGFSDMRYGEDIDFSIRIRKNGYRTRLYPAAYVYHKRRTSFGAFFRQVQHSGRARIVLYRKYPDTLKLVHALPAVFVLGVAAILAGSLFWPPLCSLLLLYALLLLVDSYFRSGRSFPVAWRAVVASFVQLGGYGIGFLKEAFSTLFLPKHQKSC